MNLTHRSVSGYRSPGSSRLVRSTAAVAALSATLMLAAPTHSVADGLSTRAPATSVEAQALMGQVQRGTSFTQLNDREKEVFRQVLLPVTTEVHSETRAVDRAGFRATAAGDGCWARTSHWAGKSAIGKTLYTWWLGSTWCRRGGRITDRVDTRGGETSTPGWQYLGHAGGGYRNMGWELRRFSREHFRLEVAGYTWQEPKPCAQLRMGARGLYSESMSCIL